MGSRNAEDTSGDITTGNASGTPARVDNAYICFRYNSIGAGDPLLMMMTELVIISPAYV